MLPYYPLPHAFLDRASTCNAAGKMMARSDADEIKRIHDSIRKHPCLSVCWLIPSDLFLLSKYVQW